MNIGIKKKLEELIGKWVELNHGYSGVYICHNPNNDNPPYKVLRFESEDCVVLVDRVGNELFVPIDHITSISIMK